MTKLNIEQSNANLHAGTSELAGETFTKAFGLLDRAFNQRLQIEREALGEAFSSENFWHDNQLAEEIINAACKKPRTKVENGKAVPVLRKGQPVFVTSRMNVRIVASAASIIRRGVRSLKALKALTAKSKSLEDAVNQADKLGGVLRMVPRLATCGLVADNKLANTAKNAAIAAFSQPGEATIGQARRALIGTLSGIGETKSLGLDPKTKIEVTFCTTAQVEQVQKAVTAWFDSKSLTKVAPAALTFDGIFGSVTSLTEHKEKKSRKLATKKAPQVAETPATIETPAESVAV